MLDMAEARREIARLVREGSFKAVMAALSREDLETRDGDGASLLHCALSNRNYEAAKALIALGIDLDVQNKAGCTALHYAGGRLTQDEPEAAFELVRRMIERGADVNLRNAHGNGPLWDAVLVPRSNHRLIALLVQAGADPDCVNKAGASPNGFARTTGEAQLLEVLSAAVLAAPRSDRRGVGDEPAVQRPRAARTLMHFEEARHIWRQYVPASGQADTVQGELLRAVEKLRNEALRNGNSNWDRGFAILLSYLEEHLLDETVFSPSVIRERGNSLRRLRDHAQPCLDGSAYDALADRVVEYFQHHGPIPRKHNPGLHR
jgi:rhodanese-related sulfurtransferase